jgi:signal transduction histidine kinase/FixJ family two-component response regulator
MSYRRYRGQLPESAGMQRGRPGGPFPKVFAWLALLIGAAPVQAQQAEHGRSSRPDSLEAEYGKATDDVQRMEIAYALMLAYGWPPDKRLGSWSDTLYTYAVARADTVRMHQALQGALSRAIGDGDMKAMVRTCSRGEELARAGGDTARRLSYGLMRADALREQGDRQASLQVLLSVLEEVEKNGPGDRRYAEVQTGLGRNYLDQGKVEEAMQCYRRALASMRGTERGWLAMRCWCGLSEACRKKGEPGLANIWMDSATATAGPRALRLYTYTFERALVLLDLGDARNAERYLRNTILVADSMGRLTEGVRARNVLARMVPDDEAMRLLGESISKASSGTLGEDRLTACRLLVPLLARNGRAMEAAMLAQSAMGLMDTLYDAGKNMALQQMQVKYNTSEKDRAIQGLQREKALQAAVQGEQHARIERQQQQILGMVLIGALLLVASLFAYRAFRVKRKAAAELERKNVEVLRQKERAEESERAKDRFLANVSHEVRTPLNAIMGFTGLLLNEAEGERSARFLGHIRDAGDNLLVVINDVLDLSRIEAGRLHLIKEPFDLHRCLHLCAEILRHRAQEQGNSLSVTIGNDVPQWVHGDSARMTQIVLNLAGNALKFTEHGRVGIVCDADAGTLRLRVRDNGIGIPADKLGAVFERFTQVQDSDQRVYGGAGLGLAIVKDLVAMHEGSIAVESAPGQGTVFTVCLPLVPAEAPARQATTTTTTTRMDGLAGRTVLIAEDNDMNALVTEETLVRCYPQARSERVKNGEEVLARLDRPGDIALILMDVQMPRLDGIGATKAIRRRTDARAAIPIIALTASVLPKDLSRCMEAGMDACVPKPFKANELLAAIERLTGATGASAVDPGRDSLVDIFRTLVPERLRALKDARVQGDGGKMLHVVHGLRPQLIHHHKARFEALCDELLRMDPEGVDQEWEGGFDRFTAAVELTLSELPAAGHMNP